MYKLIIFDLDLFLFDSKEIHFHALNQALETVDKKFVISFDEHTNIYDGLTETVSSNFYLQKRFKSQTIKKYGIINKMKLSLLNKISPNASFLIYLKILS